MKEILKLLPATITTGLRQIIQEHPTQLEEIRLRLNSAVELNFNDRVIWMPEIIFNEDDSIYLLKQLSQHSLYRMQDELKEGYITTYGGHRVGLAGKVTTENGSVKQLQHITFFNIRMAKELKDIAKPMLPYLQSETTYYNTLIIGAPQTGKTTVLRDLARLISNGTVAKQGYKVGIIDERSEIAAAYKGIPQHDIGARTDVMDACPKVDGLMMMIRSMSPDILVVDEIGKKEDVQALLEAITAGVSIMCTVHGDSLHTIKKRPSLKELFYQDIFDRFVILKRKNNGLFSIQIINKTGDIIMSNQVSRR